MTTRTALIEGDRVLVLNAHGEPYAGGWIAGSGKVSHQLGDPYPPYPVWLVHLVDGAQRAGIVAVRTDRVVPWRPRAKAATA